MQPGARHRRKPILSAAGRSRRSRFACKARRGQDELGIQDQELSTVADAPRLDMFGAVSDVCMPHQSDREGNARSRLELLSQRERRAMTLIVAGKPTKAIAYDLHVSQRTAARIRAAVFKKMQVPSAVGLASLAVELDRVRVSDGVNRLAAEPAARNAEDLSPVADRDRAMCAVCTDQTRQRLVSDLHDGPAQRLADALQYIRNYLHIQGEDAGRAAVFLERGLESLQRCQTELRQVMHGPPTLVQQAGMVAAVADLVQRCSQEHNVEIEFCHELLDPRLPDKVADGVYQIVHEALSDTCRRNHGPKARVALTQGRESLSIEIRNWGAGGGVLRFDQEHSRLHGVRQRAEAFGGRCCVNSFPESGTQILVEIPLRRT